MKLLAMRKMVSDTASFSTDSPVRAGDTPESLAQRVHVGEHLILPRAVAWFAAGRLRLADGSVMLDARVLAEPVAIDEEQKNP